MIFVSQGHQHSIGLEVFLKALSLIEQEKRQLFELVCYRQSLQATLDSLSQRPQTNGLRYSYLAQEDSSTQSLHCLQECLKRLRSEDILLTLPTSKDQLPQNGHTQFLRQYFKLENLAMVFESPKTKILLVTDHIPLREVPQSITPEIIVDKVETTLKGFERLGVSIEEVLLAGLNPHAGEGGLLGDEEKNIQQASSLLQRAFPAILFKGPLPADTLHMHTKEDTQQLYTYMYHDQGLAPFKWDNKMMGINITLGLPFLRLSVDHGTAFDLYQKDCADYTGMHWALEKALEFSKRLPNPR